MNPATERERAIWNSAIKQGANGVLVDLFEGSDRKRVIRALWAKATNIAENYNGEDNTTQRTPAELKAYAAGVLHCYNIMKSFGAALDTHAEDAKHWDGTPTKLVFVPLTDEDVKKYGSRGGH